MRKLQKLDEGVPVLAHPRYTILAMSDALNHDTMIVTNIEYVEDVGKITAVEAVEHEHLILGVERDGYRVVENDGDCVCPPVDGIDAHYVRAAHHREELLALTKKTLTR